MAYIDFPGGQQGEKARKAFWLSKDGIALVSGWRRQGVPLDEIALNKIGIGTTTFWRWQKQSPEFAQALSVSGDIVNAKVAEALLKRALGYEYDEETWELVEGDMRKTKVTRKHVAPDVKACMSWLYSRQSDAWRAIQEPIDYTKGDVENARKMLVTIKEAADGYTDTTEPEAD